MRKVLATLSLAFSVIVCAFAQHVDAPVIGAQVFVEPGQTPQQIDGWFRTLEDCGLRYARIRLFGSHIRKPDGGWDFSLYDAAFSSAQKHGIKLFVTLFPVTDELTDVGGFKFPDTEAKLSEVLEYTRMVVEHYKDSPALSAWVLQNEPGTGSSKVKQTELSRRLRKIWDEENPVRPRDGYLMADFREQEFQRWYLDWYLGKISETVAAVDPVHGRHINPHAIMNNLSEYDFRYLNSSLTSLGASMHLSWHFGYFDRCEYPLGISVMSDIIRSAAMDNPFWITELQGGNVTASGNVPLCPSREEIAQWLWTGIGAGARGIIFWTLNQRAAVNEAGEWGLLTYQGEASDRLEEASRVAKTLEDNHELFTSAIPAESGITILYNKESLWIQRLNSETYKDGDNDGRQAGAVMKSISAAYDAVSEWGVTPTISDMELFDWDASSSPCVILADCVCIPSWAYDRITSYVAAGGHLVVTGLSGFYNEYMQNSFMNGFPLSDVFGSELSEFKVVDRYFRLPAGKLESHLWKGLLVPESASPRIVDGEEVLAVSNDFGEGSVTWFPSMIDLGNWHRDESALAEFYGGECCDAICSMPFRFAHPYKDVLVRQMSAGDDYVTIMINKTGRKVRLRHITSLRHPEIIYDSMPGAGRVRRSGTVLAPEECVVARWKKD